MYQYSLELIDRIPIICIDEQHHYVLDTGSPYSFSEKEKVNIKDKTYTVLKNFSGTDTAYLKRHVDDRIKGLIGMDIITDSNYHFDYGNLTLQISDDLNSFDTHDHLLIDLKGKKSYPEIFIHTGEKQVKAIVDTGAKFSYAVDDLISGLDHVGDEEDFSPILGMLNSSRYHSFSYEALGKRFEHDIFFNRNVARAIGLLGFPILLGYDFLSAHPVTFYAGGKSH